MTGDACCAPLLKTCRVVLSQLTQQQIENPSSSSSTSTPAGATSSSGAASSSSTGGRQGSSSGGSAPSSSRRDSRWSSSSLEAAFARTKVAIELHRSGLLAALAIEAQHQKLEVGANPQSIGRFGHRCGEPDDPLRCLIPHFWMQAHQLAVTDWQCRGDRQLGLR